MKKSIKFKTEDDRQIWTHLSAKQNDMLNRMIETYYKILELEKMNINTRENVRPYLLECWFTEQRSFLYGYNDKLSNGLKSIKQRDKCIRRLKRRYEGYEKQIKKVNELIKIIEGWVI